MSRALRHIDPDESGRHLFAWTLRDLRVQAGFSLQGFAKRLGKSVSYLSAVELAQSRCTRQFAEACDRLLGDSGKLVGLWITANDEWDRLSHKGASSKRSGSHLHQVRRGQGGQLEALPGGKQPPMNLVRRHNQAVLVVLPFDHQGGAALDPYLVSGFCDDLVTELAKLGTLLVVPPASAIHVGQGQPSPTDIGREFDADAVLTGSLHESARSSLRLHLSLIDPETGVMLWAERYSFARSRLAHTHGRIVTAIAEALKVMLSTTDRARLAAGVTDTAKVYELFLRARGLLVANEERETQVALEMLGLALELDPRFASAYAARGYALWRKYFSGWDADVDTLHQALESAELALELDPTSVAAHMTIIRICWDMGWHERALQMGTLAARSNPGSLEAVLALARAYNNAGMAELALPLTRQVLAVDKANPTALKLAIWNHVMVGNFAEACEVAKAHLSRWPLDSNTRWAVALAWTCMGSFLEAIKACQEGLAADRSDVTLWVLLGYIHRKRGDEAAARRVWAEGIDVVSARLASFQSNFRVQVWLANLEAGVGRGEEALRRSESLEAADGTNGYLLYRLAHVWAEAGDPVQAMNLLEAAVDNGFLSVQLMRHEEACAFAHLVPHHRYQEIRAALERKVRDLRRTYRLGPQSTVRPAVDGGSGGSYAHS
jgi:TolB-like protein/tetratricopeptide (TPR) repeat protein/transcriptional regulator with XRE-family HTH domain